MFRIAVKPCFDASGPTLGIDVNHDDGQKLMQQMLAGEVVCSLPKLDVSELENTGLMYRKYFIYSF